MKTLDSVISRATATSPGTMLGDVYYDPLHEAAFGTLEKIKRAAKKTAVAKPDEVKPWL